MPSHSHASEERVKQLEQQLAASNTNLQYLQQHVQVREVSSARSCLSVCKCDVEGTGWCTGMIALRIVF